eukprot:jgi/Astpho2/8003/gw1.00120.266.1_t
MKSHRLDIAPIFADVTKLSAKDFNSKVDVITGGFPCQDISSIGLRQGLVKGKRSKLFFEIIRLARELRPTFIMLENVHALATKGGHDLRKVIVALDDIGYDARWETISAADLGAPHRRKRWVCLAKLRGSK